MAADQHAQPLDAQRIFEELARHEVDFALVGGLAVQTHGNTRMTNDVDLIPEPGPQNLSRLAKALRALDARVLNRAILSKMLDAHAPDRLAEAGDRAWAAEARGDDAMAGEEWRRYRLIRDAARNPDELLAEGHRSERAGGRACGSRSVTGFGQILDDLNGAGVRYVLIGGIALIRHGVVRATRDVDAVFDPDPGNVERIRTLIDQWGANATSSTWPISKQLTATCRTAGTPAPKAPRLLARGWVKAPSPRTADGTR